MNVDRLPFTGFQTTWSVRPGALAPYLPDYDPDSASTGTIWAAGRKTIDERISRGSSAALAAPGPTCARCSRTRSADNITLYWLTGTGASAARMYWESRQAVGPGWTDPARGVAAGRVHGVPRRDLPRSARLGRAGLSQPRVLQTRSARAETSHAPISKSMTSARLDASSSRTGSSSVMGRSPSAISIPARKSSTCWRERWSTPSTASARGPTTPARPYRPGLHGSRGTQRRRRPRGGARHILRREGQAVPHAGRLIPEHHESSGDPSHLVSAAFAELAEDFERLMREDRDIVRWVAGHDLEYSPALVLPAHATPGTGRGIVAKATWTG
jgi:hypothetical protein